MASTVGTAYIHVPNSPPIRIESIATLHAQGVVQALQAVGYTMVGGTWYHRDHLNVVEDGKLQGKIGLANQTAKPQRLIAGIPITITDPNVIDNP